MRMNVNWIEIFRMMRHRLTLTAALNQFPFRSATKLNLLRVEIKKMLMGWRFDAIYSTLFWHFGQLMNGSVWYAMSWKINSYQLRKNSHGKLFIIILTTSIAQKKFHTKEWKEIIFPLNSTVLCCCYSFTFTRLRQPPLNPPHPAMLSEKLLIESDHAWIKRKIALNQPNVTNKMISIRERLLRCE